MSPPAVLSARCTTQGSGNSSGAVADPTIEFDRRDRDRRSDAVRGPYAAACRMGLGNRLLRGKSTKRRVPCLLKRTYFCGPKKNCCHRGERVGSPQYYLTYTHRRYGNGAFALEMPCGAPLLPIVLPNGSTLPSVVAVAGGRRFSPSRRPLGKKMGRAHAECLRRNRKEDGPRREEERCGPKGNGETKQAYNDLSRRLLKLDQGPTGDPH